MLKSEGKAGTGYAGSMGQDSDEDCLKGMGPNKFNFGRNRQKSMPIRNITSDWNQTQDS